MEDSPSQSQLTQKLAAVRQRSQLQAAQNWLTDIGIPLDACQIFLPNSSAAQALEQWLSQSFPWQYAQIDWQSVPESICVNLSSRDDVALAFSELCQTQQLINPNVNILWFSAHQPTLAMPLQLVKDAIAEIVAQDWDTWIFEPVTGWCVEFHHEGTMCCGISPQR
ncbi:hypothetical protein [Pseudanabaena sp. ABRG5-3]|uniref:CDI toxin immunity protein n=1 Tax=Pseudanabaena sp. ABRG5-3 TaxID=685565 RepID=UPI000DC6DBD2|nr:hypothetical protein [Pseudanabaena sp. ABRG5-3]BBC26017.1 hypothetical protein ABRG53_3760 [Pseudanabaena sp. ABRG5-3]